jgi:hypothetical protein
LKHFGFPGKRPQEGRKQKAEGRRQKAEGRRQKEFSILALPGLQILPMPSQVVAGWIHLLGRHAGEGAGVFDLQIVATMLANGVHDGIDALSLASSPSCGGAVCRIL